MEIVRFIPQDNSAAHNRQRKRMPGPSSHAACRITMLSESEVAVRLVAAAVVGAVLGWERESHNKPAGIKTHMLVVLGSAAFMVAGLQLHEQLVVHSQGNNDDLLNVLAGLIGGVGFLGA